MNRRSFLKVLGLGSGTALSGCGIVDNNRYYTPVEQVLPYVVHPEQVTPGTPTYFATTIGSGPNAYPALAVHREGRVVNVMANRKAKADPAVHTSSLLELQRHFSPDRVKEPMVDGAQATWEDALKKLADAVASARSSGKKVAYLGGYTHGALSKLLADFTGGNAVHWEPAGRAAEAAAAQKLFGARSLPRYDIDKAHYTVSFGAEFLGGSWGGAWSQSAFSRARNPNADHVVCRFALVSPMKGQTGANADDWYAAIPGSEAQVALAVAKLVAQKKGYAGPAAAMLNGADVARAATASGLTAEQITQIADLFAAAPAVALPGGLAGSSAAATQLAAAVMLLNIVSGHGLMTDGGYAGPVHGQDALDALVADMKAGNVGVLLVNDSNPVHNTPGGAFAEAMANVGLTVAVSSHPDETAAACKLVLPSSDAFEDWGHEEPLAGFHIVRQPGQTPLWNSRSLGDILLATWRAVDAATAPEGDWRSYVQHALGMAVMAATAPHATPEAPEAPEAGALPDPDADPEGFDQAHHALEARFLPMWQEALAKGCWVAERHANVPRITGSIAFTDAPAPAGAGAYHLLAFENNVFGDGRYANQPWAQEVPEPMTGQVWGSWVMIHPDTAAELGVQNNDLVKLTTDSGTVEIGVEIQSFVRKDVVAVPIGQGHGKEAGRYAEGQGVNVVDLLGAVSDSGGCFAWQQAKVAVASAGRQADLVTTFSKESSDMGRNWSAVAPAAQYAAEGDKPQHHGGEFTGIHHLPMDGRLQKAEIAGFYPDPDHPTYRFAMTVDTDACTGCGACSIACYAENNLPVIGKQKVREGREMGWIRVNRYIKGEDVTFVPLMCQQCGHAPCESVCPVLATYHSIDGLNAMIYNRCVGTRYCSNACPYSARKFNYHSYVWPEPFNLQLNPDVVVRTMGVMEKCTFCVQRIRRVKSAYKDAHGFTAVVPDEALAQLPACADACPSQAITFGNTNDPKSGPTKLRKSGRNYIPIAEINTFPAVNYLARASFHAEAHDAHGGGGDHGEAAGHGEAPHDDHAPAHEAGGH